MRAIIQSTGVSHNPEISSSIEHAALAGENCLISAGVSIEDVAYLINVGVYRNSNMVEPAMAALIHKELQRMETSTVNKHHQKLNFSFDLMKGASGALNAFQLADSFFKAGRTGYALIVSSDIHPSGQSSSDFPITPCGAAVLLAPSKKSQKQGFIDFQFNDTLTEYLGETTYLDFDEHGCTARHKISTHTEKDYPEKLMAFTLETTKNFLSKHDLNPNTTALIAPSLTATFSTALGKELNMTDSSIIKVWNEFGNAHTSTFGIGLNLFHQLSANPNLTHLLLVGANAGIGTGCALYRL